MIMTGPSLALFAPHRESVAAYQQSRFVPVPAAKGVVVESLLAKPIGTKRQYFFAIALGALLGLLATLWVGYTGATATVQAAGISGAAPAAVDPPQPPPVGGENPTVIGPEDPRQPNEPGVAISVNGIDKKPATAIVVFIAITLLSIAPSLLLMMTSFTKIFITLAMTRNAIGLQQIPPNQVLAGLAVFLSFFIMGPVISDVYTDAVKPYIDGKVEFTDAIKLADPPLREFMMSHTREEDIALITRAADRPNPDTPADVPFSTLVPAFMMSEIRAAFIIGFVIFVPFVVIDLVVAASLMSMGMMMLPPVMVSLPFKVLLFVMVDGWGLMIETLVGTYR